MYQKFGKRLFDILLSFVALLVLAPIFLIIGILVKIESKGPVFFVQKRMGRNDKHFHIYKFRSMKIGTPNLATDKLEDPKKYITKIGGFLRKTSLDELPQLLNIFLGQMSFVGPRPALYNQYELIDARSQNKVNYLRPGLTGYAQIMGRDFITDQQKLEYDIHYLKNISFLFDMKIIIHTFYKVFKSENVKQN